MTHEIKAAAVPADLAEAGKMIEGVTEGPWRVDGDPWNQIVWSGADNRICFMAHSNGLDDDRDVANARFIAWAREGVPALIALATAQAARIEGLESHVADMLDGQECACGYDSPTDVCLGHLPLHRKTTAQAEAAEAALAASEAKLAVAVDAIKALRAEWHLRDLQASDFEATLAQIKGDE